MIEDLYAIVSYTVKEHIRDRVYLSLFLFGFLLLGGGLVVSALAISERFKMLTDLGLAGIEFLGLTMIVFVTVNLVLSEIENRTLYLTLSRPVARWEYILGRFLGTFLAVAAAMAIMAVAHVLVLRVVGGYWVTSAYLLAWSCSVAKIAVVGALALLVSLFSTSAASAMTFTLFFWALGHFSEELNYLGQKSANPLIKGAVWAFYNLAPNFSYFNYRDFWAAARTPPATWFLSLGAYAVCYTGVCLWLSSFVFSKREF